MCKVFVEACSACLDPTNRLILIELCENYRNETHLTVKWVSGLPNQTFTHCSHKYEIKMSPVNKGRMPHGCHAAQPADSAIVYHDQPRVQTIAQEISNREELLQLVQQVLYIRYSHLAEETVEGLMEEFGGRERFGEWDRNTLLVFLRTVNEGPTDIDLDLLATVSNSPEFLPDGGMD